MSSANGGHGAMAGRGGNGHGPDASRRLAHVEDELRHLWARLRDMDNHAQRLATVETELKFLWRDMTALHAGQDEIKRRLFNAIMGFASAAGALVGAIVLAKLGLV